MVKVRLVFLVMKGFMCSRLFSILGIGLEVVSIMLELVVRDRVMVFLFGVVMV